MGDFVLDSEGRLKLAIEGVSGYSGASGSSGFSGMVGPQGESGVSGASTSGYSGPSGSSGFSGVVVGAQTNYVRFLYDHPTEFSSVCSGFSAPLYSGRNYTLLTRLLPSGYSGWNSGGVPGGYPDEVPGGYWTDYCQDMQCFVKFDADDLIVYAEGNDNQNHAYSSVSGINLVASLVEENHVEIESKSDGYAYIYIDGPVSIPEASGTAGTMFGSFVLQDDVGVSGASGFSGTVGTSGTSGFSGYGPVSTVQEFFLASGASYPLGNEIASFNIVAGESYQLKTAGWLPAGFQQLMFSGTAGYDSVDPFMGSHVSNGDLAYVYFSSLIDCTGSGTLTILSNSDPLSIVDISLIQLMQSESFFSGSSGSSGFSGYDAQAGYSGPSGYSGAVGPSGFSGYDAQVGYSGPSGFSGYSGIAANSNRILDGYYSSGVTQETGTGFYTIPLDGFSMMAYSGNTYSINMTFAASGFSSYTGEFGWIESTLASVPTANLVVLDGLGTNIYNTSGMSLLYTMNDNGWLSIKYLNRQSEYPYYDGYNEYSGFSGQSGEMWIKAHIQG